MAPIASAGRLARWRIAAGNLNRRWSCASHSPKSKRCSRKSKPNYSLSVSLLMPQGSEAPVASAQHVARHPFCSSGAVIFGQNRPYKLVVVAPVYDDAEAARHLLEHLQRAFSVAEVDLRVLFVDDGSPVNLAEQLRRPASVQAE